MRGVLRRIAVIRIAQRAGIPLEEIQRTFAAIPLDRAPTMREWPSARMRAWTEALQQRIGDLTDLRDKLFSCIGCGCLSLTDCPLRNAKDKLGGRRRGPARPDHRRRTPARGASGRADTGPRRVPSARRSSLRSRPSGT